MERDGQFFPIEVKAKSHPGKRELSGITAFRKTYPHLKIPSGIVIAPANEIYALSSSDYVVPWNLGPRKLT